MKSLRSLSSLAPLALAFGLAAAPALANDNSPINRVVEQNLDSVVSVHVVVRPQQQATTGQSGPQFTTPPGSPFEEFFKNFENGPQGGPPQGQGGRTSAGSGFFIDAANGYLVTNNHVVDAPGNAEYTILMAEQPDPENTVEFKVHVVGTDKLTDLAVLQVDDLAKLHRLFPNLRAVTFADVDTVDIGDQVISIGNPFDTGKTVSTGIVSAKHRVTNSGPYDDFIQIDSAINRGNSGGPSFNIRGEFIGVNAQIYSPTGGSVGIGFAIPADIAQFVAGELIDHGHVTRGRIGAVIQKVSDDLATVLKQDKPHGAVVAQDPEPGSPAAVAGLKKGDVILQLDGVDVKGVKDLQRTVMGTAPGTKMSMTVSRDGERMMRGVVIGEMDTRALEESIENKPVLPLPDDGEAPAPGAPSPEAAPAPTPGSP